MTQAAHPTFKARLLSARPEAAGVRSFRFASPPGFSFTPGQFLMFHFEDDPKTWRAYSVCSSPAAAADFFEVTVGMVGDFSDRLGRLTPGAEAGLVVRGPFGRWTYDGSDAHAVLVSGGTGVTPFRAMCLLKLDKRLPGRLTLLCSARTPDGLLYRAEHEAWMKGGIRVLAAVTRPEEASAAGWTGAVGRLTAETALRAADGDAAAVYYLCGPAAMVTELKEGLVAGGVAAERVRTEKWGDYKDLFS